MLTERLEAKAELISESTLKEQFGTRNKFTYRVWAMRKNGKGVIVWDPQKPDNGVHNQCIHIQTEKEKKFIPVYSTDHNSTSSPRSVFCMLEKVQEKNRFVYVARIYEFIHW